MMKNRIPHLLLAPAIGLLVTAFGTLAPGGAARAADNQATGNVAGLAASLTSSNIFQINSATLALTKTAFLTDGTELTTGVTLPRGTVVKFMIFINNTTAVAADSVNVADVLNAAFAYQANSIKVDSSQTDVATHAAIYAAVNATAALTDAVGVGDVAGITGTTISAGQSAGNAKVLVPGNKTWAMLFTAKVL